MEPVASSVRERLAGHEVVTRSLRALARLGWFERAALLLLVVAAASPYAPPSAHGIVDPGSYTSIWSYRPVARLNLFELGFLAVGAIWLVRAVRERRIWASLDTHVAAFLLVVATTEVFAVARGEPGLAYQLLDAERIVVLTAGYFLTSRLDTDALQLRVVALTLAFALLLTASVLTIAYGVLGSTEFGTVSGRMALLITEDALLVVLPVALLWGLAADGLISRLHAAGVAGVTLAAFLVELLSLRRGAILFLTAALVVRSMLAPRPRLVRVTAAVAAVALLPIVTAASALLASAGEPGRTLAPDTEYVVRSAALQSADASSSQRTAELANFTRNLSGPVDLLFGRGVGAVWNAEVAAPVDIASYGSGETAYVRVGWHVYGLDWLYKLGVVGVTAGLFLLFHVALRLRTAVRRLREPYLYSVAVSLAVVIPIFLLFVFTNLRVALFCGAALGLVSKVLDVSSSPTGRARAESA